MWRFTVALVALLLVSLGWKIEGLIESKNIMPGIYQLITTNPSSIVLPGDR